MVLHFIFPGCWIRVQQDGRGVSIFFDLTSGGIQHKNSGDEGARGGRLPHDHCAMNHQLCAKTPRPRKNFILLWPAAIKSRASHHRLPSDAKGNFNALVL
jgi:hypothetical protein